MIMRQTATTIRLDADLKAEFDKLCEEFGMSANTAFNIYVKTVVRQRRIPFQIETAEHNNLNTKGWEAILQLGKQAEKAGIQDMPLEDVNAIIKEVRDAK